MSSRIRISDGPDWTCLTLTSPVLAVSVLEELRTRLGELAGDTAPKPLILASAHPTIFLAGAHLIEIAQLDAVSSIEFAELGRSLIARIEEFPAATIAAVHGSCSGGGFDLVLACDRIVAGLSATFSHPGVRRGLVTGWGGTGSLPVAVGRSRARRALLLGTELTVDELATTGIVTPVDGDVMSAATDHAGRLARVHRSRLDAWRELRSGRSEQLCRIVASRAIIY